jgi:hypothetical protein
VSQQQSPAGVRAGGERKRRAQQPRVE